MKLTGISSSTTRRGFSLTELAVVLAVGGVIVGGVWTVATQAFENSRQAALTTDISIIVNNVQAYYAGQNGITGVSTSLTPQLAGLSPSAIPGNLLRAFGVDSCAYAFCADTPWGPLNIGTEQSGSLSICTWDPTADKCAAVGATTQFFAISVSLPAGSCIAAAINNSGASAPPGLYDVWIGGKSMLALGHGFPVLPTDAQTWCAVSPSISFAYRLTVPQS